MKKHVLSFASTDSFKFNRKRQNTAKQVQAYAANFWVMVEISMGPSNFGLVIRIIQVTPLMMTALKIHEHFWCVKFEHFTYFLSYEFNLKISSVTICKLMLRFFFANILTLFNILLSLYIEIIIKVIKIRRP